jgi:serine protease Do
MNEELTKDKQRGIAMSQPDRQDAEFRTRLSLRSSSLRRQTPPFMFGMVGILLLLGLLPGILVAVSAGDPLAASEKLNGETERAPKKRVPKNHADQLTEIKPDVPKTAPDKGPNRPQKVDRDKLVKAKTEFDLGYTNVHMNFSQVKDSEAHFKNALRLLPGHVPSLNNLALCDLRRKNYHSAYNNWSNALRQSPGNPEILHNIVRAVSELSSKKLDGAKLSELKDFERLIAEATVDQAIAPDQLNVYVGWVYLPFGTFSNRPARLNSRHVNGKTFVASSTGTGFVAHGQYVLTNRHVVCDHVGRRADQITIIDPRDPAQNRELPASIVAVGQEPELDLAILKCDELNAPAIPLANSVPSRGTEVLILGFPDPTRFGKSLKATRGIVTGVPHDDRKTLLFDAEANPGNSGGPVCNDSGEVVAVITFITFAGANEKLGKYSGGIPIAFAHDFLRETIPNLKFSAGGGPSLRWTDIDARISPSTVMITAYGEVGPAAHGAGGVPLNTAHRVHDLSCSVCWGAGERDCPKKECRQGMITVQGAKEMSRSVTGLGPDHVTYSRVFTKRRCETCSGKGRVVCPHCIRGRDPELLVKWNQRSKKSAD